MSTRKIPIMLATFLLSACGSENVAATPVNSSTIENSSPVPKSVIEGAGNSVDDSPSSYNKPTSGTVSNGTDQTGIPILKMILTKVGQRDGKPITDFTLSAPCTSTITTTDGIKTVSWSKVQDWAARDENGRTIIELNDGRETSIISLPTMSQPEPIGNAFARVEGGFIVLAETCSKKR